ncbi:hypothetical protein [uncultured Draconibacterium sp.]|uniref:hypothetical protein n=1 Tax=uncultured Draconibacterium sp. TaxID=1573823 RepID=UPI0025D33887|nr:hypothetical protein [uncultured Draconibacterium sp.]
MKKLMIFSFVFFLSSFLFAQTEKDSISKVNNFTAVVTVQNKGISTIPNLTLGKPAVIFDMKLGRKLSFEPQFRFSLEDGKPWAMVLWWRYYGSVSERFKITYHANYSLSFKTIGLYNADGSDREVNRTNRYLVGALTPNYQLNKYIGLGAYLFYARGMDPYMIKNTYLASFQPTISNIPLFKSFVAKVRPEIYLLKMGEDGVFFSTRFLISNKNSPFSLSGLITQPIDSNIPSDYEFLWNVGVSYAFNQKYNKAH